MPNTKSAINRVKRVKKQTLVNKLRKNKYKAAVKKVQKLLDATQDDIHRAVWEVSDYNLGKEDVVLFYFLILYNHLILGLHF